MPMSTSVVVVRVFLLFALSLALVAQEPPRSEGVKLTDSQKQTLRTLQADSAAKTAAILGKLPEIAKAFHTNLLSDKPDAELDQKLSQQMVESFADVIRLRIGRIRSAVKSLTPGQRAAIAAELKQSDSPYVFDDLVVKVLGDPAK